MKEKIYFIEINESIDKERFNQLLTFISPEKQRQIKNFKFDIDRKLTLYSELLIRYFACKDLGIENNEITFLRNKYNKPYLENHPEFNFNISHTRNAIAVAISDKPIGIDIEKERKFDLKIAERFFTANEFKYITATREKQDIHFYEIWTKKEAYIKWVGKGLTITLNSFDVLFDEMFFNGTNKIFVPTISDRIQTIEKDGYIISICCDFPNRQTEAIVLKESQIETMALSIL